MSKTFEILTLEDIRGEISPILSELEELKSTITNTSLKKYYRNKDLKKVFGLSDGTINDYRNKNTIPYTQIGSIFFYPIKEIDDILKQNSNYDLIKKVE